MVTRKRHLQGLSAFPSTADSETGSILIIALWSLLLLTVLVVYLGEGVRQKITLVKRLDERGKLHYLSEAGVRRAIAELQSSEKEENEYDALGESWGNNIAAFKDVNLGDGKFTVGYTYRDEKTGIKMMRYGLVDEERKININLVDRATLERLFKLVLAFDEIEAQELAASIVDWRDADSELSIPLGSAEDFYYRNLKTPYDAKDAEFEVLEEVLLVKGVTPEIFEQIKPYITIYGNGRINVNTAPKGVLLALGIAGETVDKIVAFRNGEDETYATQDDNVFELTSKILPKLSQHSHLSPSEIAQLSVVVDKYLTTWSYNFMVKSEGGLSYGRDRTYIVAVVNKNGDILYWHETS